MKNKFRRQTTGYDHSPTEKSSRYRPLLLIAIFIFIISFIILISSEAYAYSRIFINTGFSSDGTVRIVNITINDFPRGYSYDWSYDCIGCKYRKSSDYHKENNYYHEDNSIKKTYSRSKEFIFYNRSYGNITVVYEVSNKKILPRIRYIFYNDTSSYISKGLMQSDDIDYNNRNIAKEASRLEANFTDDYYHNIFIVANWVRNNIKYNLTTLTEKTSQKASWVLKNRYGVCDEITNLFIALLASLNISSRYVGGIVYTNGSFGEHGWAEVYFPDYGWVPYDVTFGEFGYLDERHIALSYNKSSTATYRWLSHGKTIVAKDIIINGTYIRGEKNESLKSNDSITIIAERNVSRDCYNIPYDLDFELLKDRLILKLKNDNDYYLPLNLHISKAKEVMMKNEYISYLRPKETRIVEIQFNITGIEENYIYSFPFRIDCIEKELVIDNSLDIPSLSVPNSYRANYGDIINIAFDSGKLKEDEHITIEYNSHKIRLKGNNISIDTREFESDENLIYYSLVRDGKVIYKDVIVVFIDRKDKFANLYLGVIISIMVLLMVGWAIVKR